MKEVRIGLLGLGTVGAGVAKLLESERAMLEERAGCRLRLAAVADLDVTRPREGLDITRLPMTTDANRVLGDGQVDIVVELVGGLEPARSFILKALGSGKHVVTANKALLAHHGAEIYDEARRRGVMLGFEASVAGGIPLIRAVKEGLVANRVLSVFGIVNGTCNYILSKMTGEGLDFGVVLKEAQAHGYAEADPTLDIEGLDSAHKLQILVTLAYRVKLLAIAKANDGGVEVRVHPTMIPADSPLAAVSGVFNGVFITGHAVGDLMFYGRGAGQLPTASAVWSDIVEIARRIAHGVPALALDLPATAPGVVPLRPMDSIRSCYYLRVMAQDRPGVLSRVAGILGENNISIASVLQKERAAKEAVPVVMMSHEAQEKDMRAALAAIDRLRVVAMPTTMIRVEGGSA